MDIYQVIGWLIGGALAGSFVGLIVKRKREGFGRFLNIFIGMAGGVLGGALFEMLHLKTPILTAVKVSARDIVTAVAGSLVLLALVAILRRLLRGKKTADPE
jgi:uncharacterized membrane protein YeaQ/YmgE (transglycosylase-associated protein family)